MLALLEQGIERFGPTQATKYIDGMEAAFGHISKFPTSYPLRYELKPPLRVYPYGAHLIFYDQKDGITEIVRVRHGRENWTAE